MASTSPARRFAPLKQHLKGPSSDAPVLKGVVFDMDGTLWSVEKPEVAVIMPLLMLSMTLAIS